MDTPTSGIATDRDVAAEVSGLWRYVSQLNDRVSVLEAVLQRVHDELSVVDPME